MSKADSNLYDISEKLKNLRVNKGLTQKQLGEFIGLSKGTVSNYERGAKLPTIETLKILATYFNVPSDYLLGIDEDSNIEPDNLINISEFSEENKKFILYTLKHLNRVSN